MSQQRTPLALHALWVGHWPKPGVSMPGIARGTGMALDTCQRSLYATTDHALAQALAPLAPAVHRAADAYGFLLEVAAGLLSAIPGETNVFGQFKRAWHAAGREASPHTLATLAPLIAQVVCDTRSLRHDWLQGIGGASYGSLARRLLAPAAGERVLIVGAGDLARSLLPFFRGSTLGVWNRHLPGPVFAAAAQVFAPADAALAASAADCVIMTTPADAAHDRQWGHWLSASPARVVLHLGRRRHDPPAWQAGPRILDLDDVFELRQSQDNVRSIGIKRARLACREIAAARAALPDPAALRRAAG